jgi:hypothetical protein
MDYSIHGAVYLPCILVYCILPVLDPPESYDRQRSAVRHVPTRRCGADQTHYVGHSSNDLAGVRRNFIPNAYWQYLF